MVLGENCDAWKHKSMEQGDGSARAMKGGSRQRLDVGEENCVSAQNAEPPIGPSVDALGLLTRTLFLQRTLHPQIEYPLVQSRGGGIHSVVARPTCLAV